MMNTDRTGQASRFGAEAERMVERFLIRPSQPPRTLLPGEAWKEEEGAMLALRPETSVAGVAGVGGVALGGGYVLGGWCTYRCSLAVPRRFAAREGARLAAGGSMDGILRGTLSGTLQELLSQAEGEEAQGCARLKMRLNHQLQAAARRELMALGWQVTHCRLEEIRITRR